MPVASLPCPLMSTDPSRQPMKHDEKIMIIFLLPSLILSLLLLLLLPFPGGGWCQLPPCPAY